MQGVYRHEDYVIVGIDELYHLLSAPVDLGAEQTGEFAYAVVDMHDEVARLDGTQLLERQCELARACAVALECVFVEAVKYLMVGEHAHLQPLVAESLVDGWDYGGKGYVVASVGKDGLEAFYLLVAVAEDVYGVAVAQECRE